jgi:methionyl-tRNA formyltransferase
LQEKIPIGETETAGELHDRMKEIGAELLLETITKLTNKELQETSQASMLPTAEIHRHLHHAPKISTEICEIHWEKSTDEIYNLIRGLSPYPAAFTLLNGKKLKIFRAEKEVMPVKESPGEIVSDHKSFLKFACDNGYIALKQLQLEGRKKMNVGDFLRGWRHN